MNWNASQKINKKYILLPIILITLNIVSLISFKHTQKKQANIHTKSLKELMLEITYKKGSKKETSLYKSNKIDENLKILEETKKLKEKILSLSIENDTLSLEVKE